MMANDRYPSSLDQDVTVLIGLFVLNGVTEFNSVFFEIYDRRSQLILLSYSRGT